MAEEIQTPKIERDKLFRTGTPEQIWQKYCGFLDLSLDESMVIQKHLLMEEIDLIFKSELGRKMMGNVKPQSVEEFRQLVPLTTYEDYCPELVEKREDVLAEKPFCWVNTSGRGGTFKWVPYTQGGMERMVSDTLAAFILSGAKSRKDVHVKPGVKVMLNLPSRPYFSGATAFAINQQMEYQAIPPLEDSEMEFEEKIEQGFRIALRTGFDFAFSISTVLAKVGEGFEKQGKGMKFSTSMLHPAILFRLARAKIRSKLGRRPMLPKDLWNPKGLVCTGTDSAICKDQIGHYWGVKLLEFYAASEGKIIAMQSWNRKGMTFVPYSNFYEFIPEEEWLKNKEDKAYQPATVLLDEVEEGKIYELVNTNFHGMPFLRYRIGDLIKIVSLKDEEIGVNLPQMEFQSRADGIIDIAGFTRLDEKTIWRAIQNAGISYEDWSARKEYDQDKPLLRIYIEMKENGDNEKVEHLIHEHLVALDTDYANLEKMIGLKPLVIAPLSKGTFQRYLQEKQTAGFDLAHLKPAHINAPDAVIEDLLRLSQSS